MRASPRPPAQSVILVVDDDDSARESVVGLLRAAGFAVEGLISASDLAAWSGLAVVECLILDIRLPGSSGLEIQATPPPRFRGVPIVFVTGHADVPMTVRAMKAGAVDLLTKPFSETELLGAVERAVTRGRASRDDRDHLDVLRAREARLTPREREIMDLVVGGVANKAIADQLGVSEITVKVQRGRMMKKMEADTLPDLVRAHGSLVRARGG